MNQFWDQVLEFCRHTTASISERLMQDFGRIQAQEKADGSLVTQADKWSDRQLREAIAKTFPEHGVLTEETVHVFPEHDWCPFRVCPHGYGDFHSDDGSGYHFAGRDCGEQWNSTP